MRSRWICYAIICACSLDAASLWAQAGGKKPDFQPPQYLRKFQSDKDANRPTRLNQFAFRVSGYPLTEDRAVERREQWDVDPMKFRDEIVLDTPHAVRSSSSVASGPAVASFVDAFNSAVALLRSHSVFMAEPQSVTTDSGKLVIVSDALARAVHIFNLESNRYLRIQGGETCRLRAPAGVAVDAEDNIYVTDTELGTILVYDRFGRFLRYIGRRDTPEGGLFYQPSGIAIDSARRRLYVTDAVRHVIVVLDLNGTVLNYFGRPGTDELKLRQRGTLQEPGQIQFPKQVTVRGKRLYVLDKSRIQIFDLEGRFEAEFPLPETEIWEATGLAVDDQEHIFVSDFYRASVLAFDRTGHLLYSFGRPGSKHEEFSQPRGLWIDKQNRIYVADSSNGRVQVFQLPAPTR